MRAQTTTALILTCLLLLACIPGFLGELDEDSEESYIGPNSTTTAWGMSYDWSELPNDIHNMTGIDIDQIMLDYPGPDDDSIRGQWAALEEMAAQGTTKTLAVSNFSPAQLDALLSVNGATVPTGAPGRNRASTNTSSKTSEGRKS